MKYMRKILLICLLLLCISLVKAENTCVTFTDEYICEDIVVYSDRADVTIRNNLGQDGKIENVRLLYANCHSDPEIEYPITNGQSITIPLLDCSNGVAGSSFDSLLLIDYDGRYSRRVEGQVRAIVQGNPPICGDSVCSPEEKEPLQQLTHAIVYIGQRRFSECYNMSGRQLVQECHRTNTALCNGIATCDFIQSKFTEILDEKLAGLEYFFEIVDIKKEGIKDLEVFLNKPNKACEDSISKSSFLKVGNKTILLKLEACTPACPEDCILEVNESEVKEEPVKEEKKTFLKKYFGWFFRLFS